MCLQFKKEKPEEYKKALKANQIPRSPEFLIALVNLGKCDAMDELLDKIEKPYQDRRAAAKGIELDDQKLVMITQQSSSQIAMVIQQVLIPEIEKELKSRNLEVDQIM